MNKLALAAAIALACALFVNAPQGIAQERSPWVHHRLVYVRSVQGVSQRVVLTWPRRAQSPDGFIAGERLPVLIALHGAHEAEMVPSAGALAWHRDYRLDDAFGALLRGNVTEANYHSLVRRAHLDAVNESLRAHPFRGAIIATPYTPLFTGEAFDSEAVRAWGDWIAGPVLQAIREAVPAARDRAGVGIDGVSLGGRLALEVGFAHPEAFGAVGALQPAITPEMVAPIAARARAARTSGNAQHIEIVTSDADLGRPAAIALAQALRDANTSHSLVEAVGPHGYEFNRGPGAVEMLRFADRVLVREQDPPSH